MIPSNLEILYMDMLSDDKILITEGVNRGVNLPIRSIYEVSLWIHNGKFLKNRYDTKLSPDMIINQIKRKHISVL